MRKDQCKDRVTKWLRHGVDFNREKSKMVANGPTASNGFILNYINLLLILCKPFTGNFNNYGKFLSKINCFYMSTNEYIKKAKDFEKIETSPEVSEQIKKYLAGQQVQGNF